MSSPALESLRKSSDLKDQTDRMVSVAWVLLPVIAGVVVLVTVVATVFAALAAVSTISTSPSAAPPTLGPFGAGLGLVIGVSFLAEILYLYFFYILIRRRNQHFPRQRRFFSDLVTVLRVAANRKGTNVDAVLGSMENSLRDSETEETEKSAILWVILMLVPFVSLIAVLYVFYFLTGDYFKHERREDGLLSDAERTLSLLGVQFIFHRNDPVPHRSFVLFFILSIVTFGIFALYWEYVLIKDPNSHFANHRVYEPQLIQLLTPLAG